MAFGEEYFPTSFKDSVGREYVVHLTVRALMELCAKHDLSLSDLQHPDKLSLNILLDAAEIGTRYQARAKEQSREAFMDAVGDENSIDACNAAAYALINFSLRASKLPAEQCRQKAAECEAKMREMKAGAGSTFTGSLAQSDATQAV